MDPTSQNSLAPVSDIKIAATRLHRSREALIASDHLPLVAEFEVGKAKE